MTPERKAKQLKKREDRAVLNNARKIVAAENRRLALVELGKNLIKTEVPTGETVDGKPEMKTVYDLPPVINPPTISIPHLVFAGEKRRKNHGLTMKNRPGNKELHAEAIVEDASRTFANEVTKALSGPAVDGVPIPVVPINAAETVNTL